mmetsp:Transcript_3709/g.11377  ORF Transcript_3709/g.11377 Transcript_3709/m.11377 type:complete len:216 (-) Transcript_3709:946-1593(-)
MVGRELAPEVTHGRARGALRADAGPAAMRCRRGARRRGLVGRGRSQRAVFVPARRVGAFRAGPGSAVQSAESLPGMAAPAEARTRGRRRRRGAARHGEWHGDPGRSRVRRQRHLAPVPERLSQRLLGPRPRCGARARASRRGRATAGVGGARGRRVHLPPAAALLRRRLRRRASGLPRRFRAALRAASKVPDAAAPGRLRQARHGAAGGDARRRQ